MNRRRFILSSLAFIGGSAALAAGVIFSRDFEDYVAATLRRRLGDLPLDPNVVPQFSRDFLYDHAMERTGWKWPLIRRIESLFPLRPLFTLVPSARGKVLENQEEELLKMFFLSTNFLQDSRAEGNLVRYIGYGDPYRKGCAQPFAVFDA